MRQANRIVLVALILALRITAPASAQEPQGLSDAVAALGRGDYATALGLLRPLADQGNPYAQGRLGWMYQRGRGVPQDYAQAVDWYRQAADQGDAYAQGNLGSMYQRGRGVPQDDAQAAHWYRQAAEQGNAFAQLFLGSMYREGRGVPKDDAQAAHWLSQAADQGEATAQFILGSMYRKGQGVTQDLALALRLHQQACDGGVITGCDNLQSLGRAMTKHRSCDAGDATACYNLGIMYQYGAGVPQDLAPAVSLYQQACDGGVMSGCYNLGFLYQNGEGVTQDLERALSLYQQACDAGVMAGCMNLGVMDRDGTAVAQVPEFPVTISSLRTGFVVKGFFTGRVAVYPDSLVVVFDSAFVQQASAEPPISEYHLDSLTVGLVTSTGAAGWLPYHQSPALLVTDSLAERSTFSLTGLRFVLARPSARRLSQSWIVVTFYQILAPRLVPRDQQSEGTCYAHSSRTLFAAVNRQQERAVLLETAWETTDRKYTDRAEFSPKGLSFAVISRDGAVLIHDVDGEIEGVLHEEQEDITAIDYSSDGARLLTGTKAGNLGVWDLETRESTWIGKRPYEIDQVAWLGETGHALIQSRLGEQGQDPDSGELYNVQGELIDTKTDRTLWSFTAWQHLDYQNMAPSTDGEWVAIHKILGEREVYALDGSDGSISGAITKDGSGLSVAIAPDGKLIAVGTPGVSLWDVSSKQMIRHLEGHSNWVVSLAFSPDGKRLVSGSGDSTARVWDVETGVELGRIRFPGENIYVGSVSFSSDGEYVLAAAWGGRIVVAKTPPLQRRPPGKPHPQS